MTLTAIYPYLAVLYINLTIFAIALPNDLIDTRSELSHRVAVLLIFSGLVGLRQHITAALLIIAFSLVLILIHYARGYLSNMRKLRAAEQASQNHPFYKRVD